MYQPVLHLRNYRHSQQVNDLYSQELNNQDRITVVPGLDDDTIKLCNRQVTTVYKTKNETDVIPGIKPDNSNL